MANCPHLVRQMGRRPVLTVTPTVVHSSHRASGLGVDGAVLGDPYLRPLLWGPTVVRCGCGAQCSCTRPVVRAQQYIYIYIAFGRRFVPEPCRTSIPLSILANARMCGGPRAPCEIRHVLAGCRARGSGWSVTSAVAAIITTISTNGGRVLKPC